MFPMEFDHAILDSLPMPTNEDVKRVILILNVIISKRVLPYFRSKRGTDPIVIARVGEAIVIERLEDYYNRIRAVSLVAQDKNRWIIYVHERVFDYLAFMIPSDPQSRIGAGTIEEHKMLAFSEFMLRHQVEHIIYPGRLEREIIHSDVTFAMERRSEDPTYYRMLHRSFEDEMNGLKGSAFIRLFDEAEKEEDYERHIPAILNTHVFTLGDLSDAMIAKVFPCLDTELKTKVLGECYRRSRDVGYSLCRTFFIHRLLRLFDLLVNKDEREAETVFREFRHRWGLVDLLRELDLPESSMDSHSIQEVFQIFKENLKCFASEAKEYFDTFPPAGPASPQSQQKPTAAPKTLKDRIESVRNDPCVPIQVIEVIDKNKLNTAGQSGYKYSELIETLLAIPWGKIKKIEVTPLNFEEGLDRTHYGLHKPKELICDFFSNLIWRYQQFREDQAPNWHCNGSAFLFVGPPGVGKTSLAISIAEHLGVPYHKLSLGGMRDEADLRGHGFTYEGSKPGAIVQGVIKMGVMNGMFIMDEADKTEKFAIATLLEILDPEQNHLFHDKYTQTTVDIDLSNIHFVLTANTLETVPPPVVNRCEVVLLDRYSVDEKVEIARKYLIKRVRGRHEITQEQVFIDPREEIEILRYLIKTYTHEAGVRELERIIRTLFLRILRKEILTVRAASVRITREKVKEYLDPPTPPRAINEEDRVGEMMGLGINVDLGIGSLVPIQATSMRLGPAIKGQRGFLSMIHATGNIQRVMDESRKVATTAILHCRDQLGISLERADSPIHLHFMGGSTPKDGPSAGGAIALALASVLSGQEIRRDVAMTGEIDTHGRITRIGGVDVKLETAADAGCKTVIIPRENLYGQDGVEKLSEALKREFQMFTHEEWKGDHKPFNCEKHVLQIVAVDNILQAVEIAFINQEELNTVERIFSSYAAEIAQALIRERRSARRHLRVMYVKGPEELELATRNGKLIPWEERGCYFLAQSAAKKVIAEQYPELERQGKLLELDPAKDDITGLLLQVAERIRATGLREALSTLVAPFFYLKRVKSSLKVFSLGPPFKPLTIFANNYTLQGLKIKGCKPLLNQTYCFLSQLDPESLAACPFLTKTAGVYVVDLSFIPEKYRLDVKRAEMIMNRVLTTWLAQVEDALVKSGGDSPCRSRELTKPPL